MIAFFLFCLAVKALDGQTERKWGGREWREGYVWLGRDVRM